MEMHQIRYFLSVARCLNFTRAAEECNVSQPALTRAVKLLEYELGGELLRRERNHTHLTELGERMLPLLRQCHDSASSAKALAVAIGSHKLASLRLALPHAIDLAPFVPHLVELRGAFETLALRLLRGTQAEIVDLLRDGHADLAIGAAAAPDWNRLDSWKLFAEDFALLCSERNDLARARQVRIADLRGLPLLLRGHCETSAILEAQLGPLGGGGRTEIASEADTIALVAADAGVAVGPARLGGCEGIRAVPIEGFALRRDVHVFTVSGRLRGAAATVLLNQLRAAHWAEEAQAVPSSA